MYSEEESSDPLIASPVSCQIPTQCTQIYIHGPSARIPYSKSADPLARQAHDGSHTKKKMKKSLASFNRGNRRMCIVLSRSRIEQIAVLIIQPIKARRDRSLVVPPLRSRVRRQRNLGVIVVAASSASRPFVRLHPSGVAARAVASRIRRPRSPDGEVKGAVSRQAGSNQVDADFGNRVL